MTKTNIEYTASMVGFTTQTVIDELNDIEKVAVNLGNFRTAIFVMNSKTLDFTYSHTYNANNDKTTKRLPKCFKKPLL